MPLAFVSFIQYILAFVLVFMILPKLMLRNGGSGFTEVFFADFIQMVLLVTVTGYILVLTKLFEFISILIVFLVMILRKYYFSKPATLRHKTVKEIRAWLSDYTEGLVDLPGILMRKAKAKLSSAFANTGSGIMFAGKAVFVALAAGYMLYIRLYDAFVNTAPAMSDAYVTLAWVKYINNRILFHDGIYPQGYYIYQAFIQKFSGLDPLYVLKFTGPIASALIAYSIYFVVSKLLKCRYSGFIAAVAYGLYGIVFTGSWERQAASNSQEFGFLFIMPCIYFFYKYVKSGEKKDLIVAASSAAAVGLIHALAFVYAVFGIIILAAAVLMTDFSRFRQTALRSAGAVAAAAVVSLIPAGVGFIMGKELHSASAEFAAAASGTGSAFPVLMISDYVTAGCILFTLFMVFFSKQKELKTALMFLALFGAGSFLVYYFGGYITGSLVIEARARELFSIASPVMTGAGFFVLTSVFTKDHIRATSRAAATAVIVLGLFVSIRPAPIIPYKMEFNSNVSQYLRISKGFRATEWLIVSQEEGYALSYGKGWHLMTGDLLSGYDASDEGIISTNTGDEPIRVPHVFIFYEKKIHPTYLSMKELEKQKERRIAESESLVEWLADYKEHGGDLKLYYEDDDIAVYHIVQEKVFEEIAEKVIGPKT